LNRTQRQLTWSSRVPEWRGQAAAMRPSHAHRPDRAIFKPRCVTSRNRPGGRPLGSIDSPTVRAANHPHGLDRIGRPGSLRFHRFFPHAVRSGGEFVVESRRASTWRRFIGPASVGGAGNLGRSVVMHMPVTSKAACPVGFEVVPDSVLRRPRSVDRPRSRPPPE
jgi:hypothetical protein